MKKERLLFLLQHFRDNLTRYMEDPRVMGLSMALGEMREEWCLINDEKYYLQDYFYVRYPPYKDKITREYGMYRWEPNLIKPRLEFLDKLIAEL